MKKRNLFILSVATFMALCACGKSKSQSSSEESKQPESSSEPAPASSSVEPASSSVEPSSESQPESSESQPESSEEEEPYHYEDPDVELDDLEEAAFDIDFDKIEETCMINPKAKTYIDQMEAQEKTLERPYHFSSLYGPDDYAKIAAASDKGDGTTYAAADTGGVDVCQILNRNDYSNDCKNYPIVLSWDDDGSYDDAKVKFWSTEDQSDVREVPVTVSGDKASASLDNLYRARKYRAQVFVGDVPSNSIEFVTGDYPRTITMGGVHNVRDCGGFVTSYGVRSTQGLIYRGYYIDDKTNGHGKNYDAEVERVHQEVMQIGIELDVQENSSSSGNYGRTQSCLVGADYVCKTLVSYENFLKQSSYQNLPYIFNLMAHADEKHVYFHCWGGADRTGMLDFFMGAVLGYSYTDLIEEFELTTQTNNKRCHMHNSSSAHFPKFMNAFINEWEDYDPDATVNENCYNWLVDVAEVDPDDIERFREIMLPGYEDGDLDPEKLIPTYTPTDEWVVNELEGWQVAEEDENVKCNWHRHDGEDCSICHNGSGSQSGDSGNDTDINDILTRVWTKTSDKTNSDNKAYEQIKDNSKNKVGVRILTRNISAGSFDSDNRIPTTVTYKITAPKAGDYQMIMSGRVVDESKKLSERSIAITLNGANVSIDFGTRDGGLNGRGDNEFVICPTIHLTGNEDTITVACSSTAALGIGFAQDAWVVFAEH